jgi:hypothetical protein
MNLVKKWTRTALVRTIKQILNVSVSNFHCPLTKSSVIRTVDFEDLEDREEIDSVDEYNQAKKKAQDQIDHLTAQMEGLAPNLKAIEQFEEISSENLKCFFQV